MSEHEDQTPNPNPIASGSVVSAPLESGVQSFYMANWAGDDEPEQASVLIAGGNGTEATVINLKRIGEYDYSTLDFFFLVCTSFFFFCFSLFCRLIPCPAGVRPTLRNSTAPSATSSRSCSWTTTTTSGATRRPAISSQARAALRPSAGSPTPAPVQCSYTSLISSALLLLLLSLSLCLFLLNSHSP